MDEQVEVEVNPGPSTSSNVKPVPSTSSNAVDHKRLRDITENMSPLRLKKVKLNPPRNEPSPKGLPKTSDSQHNQSDDDLNNSTLSESSAEKEEDNELSCLESLILKHKKSLEKKRSEKSNATEHDSDGSSDHDDFDYLGGPSSVKWHPSEKTFRFFLKVADIDLNNDIVKELSEKYVGTEELDSHFEPPNFLILFGITSKNLPLNPAK